LDGQRSLAGWAETRRQEGHEPAAEVLVAAASDWQDVLDLAKARLVVVDTPPGVDSPDQLAAIRALSRAADLVLAPTLPHPPSLVKVADMTAALGRRGGADVWFVLNGCLPRRAATGEALDYLRQRGQITPVELPLRDDVYRAFAYGLGVVEDKRLGGYPQFLALWQFASARLALVEAAA
jgi:cellulose biosynthesis protein BcsQ